jgi:hypothetical protein
LRNIKDKSVESKTVFNNSITYINGQIAQVSGMLTVSGLIITAFSLMKIGIETPAVLKLLNGLSYITIGFAVFQGSIIFGVGRRIPEILEASTAGESYDEAELRYLLKEEIKRNHSVIRGMYVTIAMAISSGLGGAFLRSLSLDDPKIGSLFSGFPLIKTCSEPYFDPVQCNLEFYGFVFLILTLLVPIVAWWVYRTGTLPERKWRKQKN